MAVEKASALLCGHFGRIFNWFVLSYVRAHQARTRAALRTAGRENNLVSSRHGLLRGLGVLESVEQSHETTGRVSECMDSKYRDPQRPPTAKTPEIPTRRISMTVGKVVSFCGRRPDCLSRSVVF